MKTKPEAKPPGGEERLKRPFGPKAPTPLWLARRKSMLEFGYDPRDTATP